MAPTNYDITNYFEAVPSNALERVLWLEADRMRALKVDDENLRNQRDVVKEEVRVNVMNHVSMADSRGSICRPSPSVIGPTRTISMAISRIWMRLRLPTCRVSSGPITRPITPSFWILGDFEPAEAFGFAAHATSRIFPAGPPTSAGGRFRASANRGAPRRSGREIWTLCPPSLLAIPFPSRGTADWHMPLPLVDRVLHGRPRRPRSSPFGT